MTTDQMMPATSLQKHENETVTTYHSMLIFGKPCQRSIIYQHYQLYIIKSCHIFTIGAL